MDRLPSLLVFGSQSAFPSDETSGQIRQELIDNPQLSKLLESVRDLPHFWKTLVNFDSRLEKVVGAVSLDQLSHAIAVAVSGSEDELASWGAVAFRLAVVIGAYVDIDSIENARQHAAIAIRWRSGKKEDRTMAYVSSINDDASLTITLEEPSVSKLIEAAHSKGLHTKRVPVQGRFHTTDYSKTVEKLYGLASQTAELKFPAADNLRIPLPHINGVAGFDGIHEVSENDDLSGYPSHSIAIVGMAGRFPGADSVDELWDLIQEGKTMVEPAPVDRLALPQTGDHAETKWWGNFLKDPDAFDHKFFKKPSREALAWDPQQRILLEVIYQALESASYFGPSSTDEPLDYGCYIGAVMNNYYDNLSCHAGTAYATNLAAAGFLSPSGQCKPFDADADGYCRGEAVAVVVLKPLADAMKDNDNILGVVTGSAANQNYNLAHITQPQSTSQVELYQNVMRLSGVDAEAVSYVEAHGTGTGVGDPIEVRSIRDAFGGPQRDSLLHFSSIKGNIGHTEATAGVAGLIKVLLMMRHRRITAQASHNSLNPKLPDFQQHQMVIPRKNMDWKAPYFLACVNSYGAAGSNSAVMIRQSPHRTKGTPFTRQLTKFPIFISAGSQDGLVRSAVLVFGGQESNFIGLSREVYETSSIFQYHLDKVNDLLIASGQASFFPSIFESDPIDSLAILHSGLFAVQYASAMAWIESGLSVSAVVGHSFGQLTALCLSGALSLTDALKLVSGRASLMQQHWGPEPGSMLFLQADRPTVEDIFRSVQPPYAEVACYNGPQSHVVVGTSESIAAIQQHVEKTPQLRASVRTKKLNVTNGFHSEFTEPLLPHLAALAEELEWRTPTTHLETTEELPHSGELGADFVSDHTRKPVFFQRAVERLASQFPQATWLEAGRGSSVMQLVKLSVPNAQDQVFHSPQLTAATAQSSLVDITIDFLPPIQFEKTRHWLGFTGREPVSEQKPEVVKEVKAAHELLSFVNFRDKAKSEADFSIDPKADRFQQMLGGHVMAGQALAPASLYFEVVARAALLLEDDTEAQRFVPTVNNLLMRSPIGRDTDKRIILVLKKTQGMTLSWSFSIATQDLGANAAQPFEVSTGEVILKKKDDSKAAREFERFETLIGRRRCDDILAHPDAENMQGNHIYRAFNTVVYYGEDFRGIKHVACLRNEAAGKVRVTPSTTDPADQRLCDTPMTDSFMQFAGFLVNYFNNPSMDDVFVCMKIEHIEIGGDFDPDAGEWLIYSTMSEGGETDASSDAYIFDARTNKMVMAAFGFRFSKMSQNLLGRLLRSVNKSSSPKAAPKEDTPVEVSHIRSVETAPTSISTKKVEGKRKEVLQILSNVTDIPLDEIHDESTLDDLGVDSLMGTEVLNDIRAVLGLTIDLSSFLFFPNIQALIAHVNGQLGLEADEESSGTDSGLDGVDTPFNNNSQSGNTTPEEIPLEDSVAFKSVERPAIKSASSAFEETRLNYDYLAESTGAAGFWRDAYPHQSRLVLAYVVEAFASLGVDLKRTSVGAQVPQIKALDKHKLLVRQLYRVLEDGKLIAKSPSDPQRFVRTTSQVEPRSAESIFHEVVDLYPQHAVVIKLVRAVGSEFAACLHGDKEGIQLVFGDRETKKNLEEMYEFWPLLRTPALVLGDFLAKAFTHRASGTGKFRILEIGAGTGGTTRFIINHLKSLGIDFEYVFTDLGASLVNAAQKQFKGVDNMTFDVLDLEKPPKPEYQGAFHCVLATNCVHATRDLDLSLKHARSMLRDDGMLTLIEITQNMFWLDIVVGLFEGWWLFNDGREHALVDEKHWERRMKGAGFEEVAWSDGATPESKTVRLIAAFPKKAPEKPVKAGFETVVYKTVDDLDIQADIYYPLEGEVLPAEKMPVGV
ncbi:putative Phthiocerol synthesis polyketide synthase type I PpsA [Sarocladium strictum]